MRSEQATLADSKPGIAGIAITPAQIRQYARYAIGTLFGILTFAGALMATDIIQFSFRMPGYIVMYWFPALMLARVMSGYRGSGIISAAAGSALVRTPGDTGIVGFMLAACIVEAIMLLVKQNPSAFLGIIIGIAASFGKMIPKVATVLLAGSTPHHNRNTLPFMLESYFLFGAIAGFIYVTARYTARTARKRLASPKTENDPSPPSS